MALSRVGLTGGAARAAGTTSIKQVSGGAGGTNTTLPVGGTGAGQVDGGTSSDTEGTVNDGEIASDNGNPATTTTTATSATPVEKALSINERMLKTIQDANANKPAVDPSMFQKDPMADMLPALLAGAGKQQGGGAPSSGGGSPAKQSEPQKSSTSGNDAIKGLQEQMAKTQAENQKALSSLAASIKSTREPAKPADPMAKQIEDMSKRLANLEPKTGENGLSVGALSSTDAKNKPITEPPISSTASADQPTNATPVSQSTSLDLTTPPAEKVTLDADTKLDDRKSDVFLAKADNIEPEPPEQIPEPEILETPVEEAVT